MNCYSVDRRMQQDSFITHFFVSVGRSADFLNVIKWHFRKMIKKFLIKYEIGSLGLKNEGFSKHPEDTLKRFLHVHS